MENSGMKIVSGAKSVRPFLIVILSFYMRIHQSVSHAMKTSTLFAAPSAEALVNFKKNLFPNG